METIDNCKKSSQPMKKIVLGTIIIFAGLFLLAENFGFLNSWIKHVIFSWPMILIVIGVVSLASRDGWLGGTILILLGSYFLLPRLFPFDLHIGQIFWPSLLILLGVGIMLKGFGVMAFRKKKQDFDVEFGYIDESNVFGGNKYTVSPVEFKGGKVTNVFGGSEINLTQTTLSPGKNILEVDIVFGGITLIVPPNWIVRVQTTSIFGGVSDKRGFVPRGGIGSGDELIIKGSIVFGGAEIKS
jgi:predicted membrane protein